MVASPTTHDATAVAVGALHELAAETRGMWEALREKQRHAPLVPDAVMMQSALDSLAALEVHIRQRASAIEKNGMHLHINYVTAS